MVSDAAALKHILSETSTFVRSPQQQQIVRMLLGEGSLFYVHGIISRSFISRLVVQY